MLGDRMAASRKRAGLTQVELAVALGDRYDRAMISMVETKRSGLLLDGATKAAQALNVSLDYLVGLTDDPTPSVEREETLDQLRTQVDELSAKPLPEPAFPAAELLHQEADPELAWVGKYGVLGSAGPGAFVDSEHVVKQIGFRRDWLRKKGLNPAKCSVIDVHGYSMEPTLHHGAMILIDHQRTRRLKNRIFAVRSDDGPLIKRLMHDNHHWLLVSDNEEYKPVKWPREAVVIGQVMWTGRTL